MTELVTDSRLPIPGASTERAPGRWARRAPGEPRAIGYLYLAPALVIYGAFVLFPFVHAGWISLFTWDGLGPSTWAGLGNYQALFTDDSLRAPFLHSLILLLFYAGLPVVIGFLLAAVLSRRRLRGMTFFRAVLFLPQVIAMVVVAVAWRSIYAPDGLLNQVLRWIGLGSITRAWLGDFRLALPAVGLVGTWVEVGLCLVLFLAGAQRIPRDLYEAARMDGAGAIREFFVVTLPGLRGEASVALTLTIVAGLRNFDLVYLTTSGGPGNATSVPSYEVYRRAFETNQVGSAAAIGIGLTVVIFIVTFIVTKIVEGPAQ